MAIKKKDIYIIPKQKLLAIARKLIPKIRNSSGYHCEYDRDICNPHKFLNQMEEIIDFLYYSVEEKMVYYSAFEFFQNESNSNFFGWSHVPIKAKNLNHLSYSRRLAYLN